MFCLLTLKVSIFETRKNVSYYKLKAPLFLETFKFVDFQNLKFYKVIRFLSVKQEIHLAEKLGE